MLYEAQREQRVAERGPYARIRHPQYVAFVLVMFGFLPQWPTLITLVLFPILLVVYARLARHEERDAVAEFRDAYRRYLERRPAFVPPWVRRGPECRGTGTTGFDRTTIRGDCGLERFAHFDHVSGNVQLLRRSHRVPGPAGK